MRSDQSSICSRTLAGIRSSLGIAKSFRTTDASRTVSPNVEIDVRQLEEPHRVRLGDLALHYLARDLPKLKVEPSAPRGLGHGVVEAHLPLPAKQVGCLDPVVGHLVHDLVALVDGHGASVAPTWTMRPALRPCRCGKPSTGSAR